MPKLKSCSVEINLFPVEHAGDVIVELHTSLTYLDGEHETSHQRKAVSVDLLFERVHELLDNIALRPITNKLATQIREARKAQQK